MNILSLHKRKEKSELKDFNKQFPKLAQAFLRFQLENNARCVVGNIYQDDKNYPPNVLVDFVVSNNRLSWRPLNNEDKKDINDKLDLYKKQEELQNGNKNG